MPALIENIDFYFDRNGYMVLTEKYLKERNICCGKGCRHCPFDYENVLEPRRTTLLQQRHQD